MPCPYFLEKEGQRQVNRLQIFPWVLDYGVCSTCLPQIMPSYFKGERLDILLSDVRKTYNGPRDNRIIFQEMTASFPSGKFCVILGKSGVGKSSLLNLISGIDTPDKG